VKILAAVTVRADVARRRIPRGRRHPIRERWRLGGSTVASSGRAFPVTAG
jgi:hypothetical protein